MKKLCIVTWFDSYNYGTQLQSAALFNYLKQQGLDVYMLGQLRIHKMLLMHPQLLITKIAVKLNDKNRKAFFHPVSYDISEERSILQSMCAIILRCLKSAHMMTGKK